MVSGRFGICEYKAMKQATPELITLLNSGSFEREDLYTITLRGGSTIRFTSGDRDIRWGGNTYPSGSILVDRDHITDTLGLDTSTLGLSLSIRDLSSPFLVGGVPLIRFISGGGLNGASLKLEKAFSPSLMADPTGVIIRFAGKILSIDSISELTAHLTVSSWSSLLNVNYPVDIYQSGCMWVVYSPGCGLLESSFRSSTTSLSGSNQSRVLTPSLGGADYNQGRMKFTSGANTGISRTIRLSTPGVFDLIAPLPSAPALGDSLEVSFGCDLLHTTCASRFNNQLRFKGTPFIPTPEASL